MKLPWLVAPVPPVPANVRSAEVPADKEAPTEMPYEFAAVAWLKPVTETAPEVLWILFEVVPEMSTPKLAVLLGPLVPFSVILPDVEEIDALFAIEIPCAAPVVPEALAVTAMVVPEPVVLRAAIKGDVALQTNPTPPLPFPWIIFVAMIFPGVVKVRPKKTPLPPAVLLLPP
jgi:hypothetical protein